MVLFLDSFWRAAVYCLHPRVIFLSLLPLVILVALTLLLGYFFWDAATDTVRTWVDGFPYLDQVWQWLDSLGLGSLQAVLVPLLLVFMVTPVIVVATLLAVSWLMTPALVNLVASRRYPELQARQGGGVISSLIWSLGSVGLAGFAMLISIPLWLLPPMILLVPPLIWGWLTFRVMAFDALAKHASKAERQALFRSKAGWLLLIGVICGYLGASPSMVWAMGTGFAPAFVFLVPVAIWIYTLVFIFAALWFIHYCLGALQQMRQTSGVGQTSAEAPPAAPRPQLPGDQATIQIAMKDQQ